MQKPLNCIIKGNLWGVWEGAAASLGLGSESPRSPFRWAQAAVPALPVEGERSSRSPRLGSQVAKVGSLQVETRHCCSNCCAVT